MITQIEQVEFHSADDPPKTDGIHAVPILAQSDDKRYKSTYYMSKLKHGNPTKDWFYGWSEYDANKHCYRQVKVIGWAKIPEGWTDNIN